MIVTSSGPKPAFPETAGPAPLSGNREDGRSETKRLAHEARLARRAAQAKTCRILEKQAFYLAELARESNLGFLVYLFDMARVAAVDEGARLGQGEAAGESRSKVA